MTRGADDGPHEVVFTLRGDADAARAAVEEFFVGRGWTPHQRGTDRVDYEIGSRRRTILLGGLAGRAFFLTAQTSVREDGGSTVVRYRWGTGAGHALGGSLGRAKAARTHQATASELERALEKDGRLLSTRRV